MIRHSLKKTALSSILAAVSMVLLLLSQFLPTVRFGFAVMAGFPILMTALTVGCKYGFFSLLITSILGVLLFPGKATVICYIVLFGGYPLAQVFFETKYASKHLLKIIFKILFSQIAFFFLFICSKMFLSEDMAAYPRYFLLLVWAVYLILFFVYDKLLIYLGSYFMHRFHPTIHKFIQ